MLWGVWLLATIGLLGWTLLEMKYANSDLSTRLNIPLIWLVNCSGVKLTNQEKFYANRRCGGTPFYRHAELSSGTAGNHSALHHVAMGISQLSRLPAGQGPGKKPETDNV